MFDKINSIVYAFPGAAIVIGSTIGGVAGYVGGRVVGRLTDESIPAILGTYASIALPIAGVITTTLLKENCNQHLIDSIMAVYKK